MTRLQTWVSTYRLVFGYRLDDAERDRDDWSRAASSKNDTVIAHEKTIQSMRWERLRLMGMIQSREQDILRLEKELTEAWGLPRHVCLNVEAYCGREIDYRYNEYRFRVGARTYAFDFLIPHYDLLRMREPSLKRLVQMHADNFAKIASDDIRTEVTKAMEVEITKVLKNRKDR